MSANVNIDGYEKSLDKLTGGIQIRFIIVPHISILTKLFYIFKFLEQTDFFNIQCSRKNEIVCLSACCPVKTIDLTYLQWYN